MTRIKPFLIIVMIVLSFSNGLTQTTKSDSSTTHTIKQHLIYGGVANLNLGRFNDIVYIQPYIGYKISPRVYTLLGSSYSYVGYAVKIDNEDIEAESNFIGLSLSLGYYPFNNKEKTFLNHIYIQMDGEYLVSYVPDQNSNYSVFSRSLVPLIGIGYKLPLGNRLKLNCYLGAALVQNKKNIPYRNPMISIGVEY